jgi:hypothetical protein
MMKDVNDGGNNGALLYHAHSDPEDAWASDWMVDVPRPDVVYIIAEQRLRPYEAVDLANHLLAAAEAATRGRDSVKTEGDADVHRIHTEYDVLGYRWECECGVAGTGPLHVDADQHSDEHINYGGGETRVDVHTGRLW